MTHSGKMIFATAMMMTASAFNVARAEPLIDLHCGTQQAGTLARGACDAMERDDAEHAILRAQGLTPEQIMRHDADVIDANEKKCGKPLCD